MYQNRYAPRLARLHRARGRRPAFAAGQNNLRAALTDNRARLCGREGKTRDALYTLSRADCGNRMGQAQICCDESQETCHPQVATFLPLPVFFMLEAPLLHCNGAFLSFTGFASRIRYRAAKSAKYENLWVFIRYDAHVVRAGLNIRGCRPLSTLGFFDRLSAADKISAALFFCDLIISRPAASLLLQFPCAIFDTPQDTCRDRPC